METIELVNDGTGLGFGIVGGKTTGVIVKTILPGGIADQVMATKMHFYFIRGVTSGGLAVFKVVYSKLRQDKARQDNSWQNKGKVSPSFVWNWFRCFFTKAAPTEWENELLFYLRTAACAAGTTFCGLETLTFLAWAVNRWRRSSGSVATGWSWW